jgi:hypothetical protein
VDACGEPPQYAASPEQFISLEQSSRLTDDYQCLVEAIQEVWSTEP